MELFKTKTIDEQTSEFLETIKNGGFFIIKGKVEQVPFLIGYAVSIAIDGFRENWHRLHCAFFYNFRWLNFVPEYGSICGCSEDSYARPLSIEEYNCLGKMLNGFGYIFNKKKKKLEKHDFRKR